MTDRSPRRPGIALLATAKDREQAADWQARLVDAGIQSIVRGHRANGDAERRPTFSGLDIYVPATLLPRAREIVSPVATAEQFPPEPQRFPWVWLFAGPTLFFALLVILAVVFLL
jgi:hypothetical protein